jgi:lipoprotein NlpD
MTPSTRTICAALATIILAGCASGSGRAPVSEQGAAEKKSPPRLAVAPSITVVGKTASREIDWRPQTYVVQKGDTLYGIAFNYGMDYHEIAELNTIQNPDMIQAGQELRLFQTGTTVEVKPAMETKPVEAKSLAAVKPPEITVIDQPIAIKLPYSENAVAQIDKMLGTPHKSEPILAVKATPKAEPAPEPKPAPTVAVTAPEDNDEAVDWSMPTKGKVIAEFSEANNRKGIDVAGKLGQPVLASAAGKVVYSGSGLRGYGKLVIIKHNSTYLSAYAHNDQVLVKEGQTVTKGQKIAEMGNSDTDQVKLHFEIRKLGKPVDPLKYLPQITS